LTHLALHVVVERLCVGRPRGRDSGTQIPDLPSERQAVAGPPGRDAEPVGERTDLNGPAVDDEGVKVAGVLEDGADDPAGGAGAPAVPDGRDAARPVI
jgi:hypothetical protein